MCSRVAVYWHLTSHGHTKCVLSLHKSTRIYMGVIILGCNTLYINFCLLKHIPMASKWLMDLSGNFWPRQSLLSFTRLRSLSVHIYCCLTETIVTLLTCDRDNYWAGSLPNHCRHWKSLLLLYSLSIGHSSNSDYSALLLLGLALLYCNPTSRIAIKV